MTSPADSGDGKESFDGSFLSSPPKIIRSSFKEISPSESSESSACSSFTSNHSSVPPPLQTSKFLIINDDNDEFNNNNSNKKNNDDEYTDYEETDYDELDNESSFNKSSDHSAKFKRSQVKDLGKKCAIRVRSSNESSSFGSNEEIDFDSPIKSAKSKYKFAKNEIDAEMLDFDLEGSLSNQSRATSNSIHCIRERQRRLRLKKLLIKLKISLYEEAGSLEKYDFDESLIKIDDYFGKKNSKTMRSKQNILQEVDINFSFSFF